MVELAWVERDLSGFIVRRAHCQAVGETLAMRSEAVTAVLVLSAVDASRLGDAEVLMAVAESLVRDAPRAGTPNPN